MLRPSLSAASSLLPISGRSGRPGTPTALTRSGGLRLGFTRLDKRLDAVMDRRPSPTTVETTERTAAAARTHPVTTSPVSDGPDVESGVMSTAPGTKRRLGPSADAPAIQKVHILTTANPFDAHCCHMGTAVERPCHTGLSRHL